ncbi:MAG: SO_0444 family Cu/Zn efflux transporter [Phycisphaeraceae bacterium]|nr:SO_0444 family Cu/Zn efflux transporter [Phycisphaeraceae bacterium]
MDWLTTILLNCWLVLGEMGPYLLLGFAIAGAMSVLVSAAWVSRHLGGRGMMPVFKATVLGVPLPLCSCGVIPVSAGLRRQGASRGATGAFLLATPETGVDSMLATYALLGPVFAVLRPLVALVGGMMCGLLINLWGEQDEAKLNIVDQPAATSCAGGDCCATDDREHGNRFVAAARYGFVTLPRDIAVHLLIGVVIAGLLTALIEPNVAARWLGGGWLAMLLMMAIGLPLYVCATGSIPMAVAFMHLGASPGAALVFLIAGPATNAATIGVTWKLLGKRSAILYLLVTAATALAAGFGIDALGSAMPLHLPDVHHEHAAAVDNWFNHLSAAALLVVLAGSFFFSRKSHSGEKSVNDREHQTVLNVLGMTCSHCAAAVAAALRQQAGVVSVDVDLAGKMAVVRGNVADPSDLVAAVEQLGYSAALREGG